MSGVDALRPDHRDPGAPIELRIQHIGQLFHTLDPYPFRQRDLDADVEEYVVGWAQEMDRRRPLAIAIRMPAEQAQGEDAVHIAEAFRNYFQVRAEVLVLELRTLFRTGRDAGAIGLAVLAVTIVLGGVATRFVPVGFPRRFLEEGLIILGWVANWKPIEIFLFEWWPLARKRRLYQRLTDAKVELLAENPAARQ